MHFRYVHPNIEFVENNWINWEERSKQRLKDCGNKIASFIHIWKQNNTTTSHSFSYSRSIFFVLNVHRQSDQMRKDPIPVQSEARRILERYKVIVKAYPIFLKFVKFLAREAFWLYQGSLTFYSYSIDLVPSNTRTHSHSHSHSLYYYFLLFRSYLIFLSFHNSVFFVSFEHFSYHFFDYSERLCSIWEMASNIPQIL
jgi:hypothetical protein